MMPSFMVIPRRVIMPSLMVMKNSLLRKLVSFSFCDHRIASAKWHFWVFISVFWFFSPLLHSPLSLIERILLSYKYRRKKRTFVGITRNRYEHIVYSPVFLSGTPGSIFLKPDSFFPWLRRKMSMRSWRKWGVRYTIERYLCAPGCLICYRNF